MIISDSFQMYDGISETVIATNKSAVESTVMSQVAMIMMGAATRRFLVSNHGWKIDSGHYVYSVEVKLVTRGNKLHSTTNIHESLIDDEEALAAARKSVDIRLGHGIAKEAGLNGPIIVHVTEDLDKCSSDGFYYPEYRSPRLTVSTETWNVSDEIP